MENINVIIENWDNLLNDIGSEEFDLDSFQETAKETFVPLIKVLKDSAEKLNQDIIRLIIKITRFVEKEIVSDDQQAANYLVEEILYAIENGLDNLDIDASNVLTMYAPDSYDKISIDLCTCDLTELLNFF